MKDFYFFVANPQQEMHHLKNRLKASPGEKTRKEEGVVLTYRWNDWSMMGSVLIEAVKVDRTLRADGGRATAKRRSGF